MRQPCGQDIRLLPAPRPLRMLCPCTLQQLMSFFPPFFLLWPLLSCRFSQAWGGVSGAFFLLPLQISLGYTNPSVSATNHLFNVIATPGGVWRYYREGRLPASLARCAAPGSLPGVLIGAFIRLEWPAEISRFKIFAAAVLLLPAARRAGRACGHVRGRASRNICRSVRFNSCPRSLFSARLLSGCALCSSLFAEKHQSRNTHPHA